MPKISQSLSQNKKTLVLIIGVGLILSLIPSDFAEAWTPWDHCFPWDVFCILAGIGQYLLSIPIRVGFLALVLPIILVTFITGLIFAVVVAITNWMTVIALSVGITPAAGCMNTGGPTPDVVCIGWDFTKDFVNMFFIIILVFIGLATILKIREYEAKKALPRLILTALLINFTPVIVGFIVDMGNLVTNFFITKSASVMDLQTILNMVGSYLGTSINTILLYDGQFFTKIIEAIGVFSGIVIYGVSVIVFFLLGSWIYLWVMLTFFLRIVMLWILTILAPIAFLSHIFPASKNIKKFFPSILHWDGWWEEFLQWIVVGIPLGFFLYLSNWIMANTSAINEAFRNCEIVGGQCLCNGAVKAMEYCSLQTGMEGASGYTIGGNVIGLEDQFISLVTSILAPTVALVLLYKGYKIAKETAPAAARGIIEGVKKIGTLAAAAGITVATAGAGAGFAAKALGGMSATAQKFERKIGGVPKIGKALKFGVGKPISWGTRGMEKAIAPSLLRYAAKARRVETPPGFKDFAGDEIEQSIRSQPSAKNKVRLAAKAIDLKKFNETGEEFHREIAKEAEGLAKDTHHKREVKKIMKALPNEVTEKMAIDFVVGDEAKKELKEKIDKIEREISLDVKLKPQIKKRADERGITTKQAARDISAGIVQIDELKSGDMTKIATKKIWTKPGMMEGIQRSCGGAQLKKMAEEFEPGFADDYMEVARKKGFDWFLENNPNALPYLYSAASQEFGFGKIGEVSKEDMQKLIKWYREEKERRKKRPRPPYEM